MSWYIGQEVVCVKTHEHGAVVMGKVYTIKGLQISPCKCGSVNIDVGVASQYTHQSCFKCHDVWQKLGSTVWLDETRFAPLMDITELKEILNEEIQRV